MKTGLIIILTIPMLAALLPAQSQKTQAMLMALQANGKQTISYDWKQKTTVYRKGNPGAIKVDEIRFDATGRPQRMTLVQPEQKRMGPLMARKAAHVKESVEEVMQLAGRYANPQEIAQALRRGEVWEGPGSLKVRSRSVILPSDEVTIAVNTSSLLPARIDIQTRHEGSPVVIAIDYDQLPGGPSMMTRMTVRIPGEDIVVNVESYDFMRLAAGIVH